jgi:hypothetical protein
VLDSSNIVALCPHHHRLVSEHKWSDLIYAHPDGSVHYNVKDENGQDKCDRAIGTWSAEARAYHLADDLPSGDVGQPGIPETHETFPIARSKSQARRLTAQTGHNITYPEDASYGPTSLTLREGLSYERWQEIGATLQNMERSVAWWIGDWLNYGERTYGETYAQAVEATGMKTQTLLNYASVASRVDLPTRVDSLSWSHHREVAALEPPKQVALLARAEAEHLSTRELRQLVKGTEPEEGCKHEWQCVKCGAAK